VKPVASIDLRSVSSGDAELVFGWRNDPFVIARSSSQRGVSHDEHLRWMNRVVDAPDCLCLIIVVDGTPAGQVRFDRDGSRAVVTVYLLEQFTGRGVGVRALVEGARLAFARWSDVDAIDALVRLDNFVGRKAFRRAQFASAGETADGHEKFVLTRAPDDIRAEWDRDTAQNRAFYADRDAQFGIDVRAVDWGSRESQVRRFEVLAQIGPLGSDSVLDVGCGQGDFYEWLRGTGYRGEYTGIDITPAMVRTARRRFSDAAFLDIDLMSDPTTLDLRRDWIFASGIFTFRRAEAVRYMESMIATMFGLARKGLAVNSLSAWADRPAGGEFRADPLHFLGFCRALTPFVVLRHDYHPGDFTLYLYNGVQRAAGQRDVRSAT